MGISTCLLPVAGKVSEAAPNVAPVIIIIIIKHPQPPVNKGVASFQYLQKLSLLHPVIHIKNPKQCTFFMSYTYRLSYNIKPERREHQ